MSHVKHNRNADPKSFEPWLRLHVHPKQHEEARRAWRQGWRAQLAWVKKNMLHMRDDGTGLVGIKTQSNRGQTLFQAFTQLRELGYKIANILSFNQTHLIALITLWVKQVQDPGTISDRRSVLSVFTKAIGKGGLVPPVKEFAKLGHSPSVATRETVARVDKSWSAEESAEASKTAHILNYKYGLIFDLIARFGLRGKEGCLIEPHLAD